jgi:tetratricopeptide (TPR) repeat protein
MLAFEEAARHYQAALSALDAAGDADGDRQCALFLGLGEAQARAGAQAAAQAAFWRATELAETLGRSGVQARAALGYGGRFLWGRAAMDERLAPMLERALAALDPGERRLRVLLMARLAGATRTGGLAAPIGPADLDGAYARAIGAEAVERARELEDPEVLAYALEGQLLALCGPDSIGEQLELAREVLVLAREAGDHERLFGGIENLCHIMLELGDVITAERHAEELLRLAELMRQPPQLWMAHAVRASLALWRGQLDVAEAAIEEAFGYGRDAQTWNAEITYHVQTFMLRRAQLRLDEAEAGLRQALADHPSYQLIRCLLADLLALLGRASEARTVLDALAPRAFRAVPRDDTWLHAMAVLAEATATVGHREHAKTLLRLLARYEDRVAYVAPDGSAGALARGLGLLAVTAGEQATATRYFDRALAINERTESRTALADTQRDYARLLGAGPEREELASLALAHYESMGMFAAAEAMRAEQPV